MPLTEYLVTWQEKKRTRYLLAFCDQYSNEFRSGSVKFSEKAVCITMEERKSIEDINKKTIAEITNIIEHRISLVVDEVRGELQEEFEQRLQGKRALKEDYLAFHIFLEDILEMQILRDYTPPEDRD